jgi:hypothetical protein
MSPRKEKKKGEIQLDQETENERTTDAHARMRCAHGQSSERAATRSCAADGPTEGGGKLEGRRRLDELRRTSGPTSKRAPPLHCRRRAPCVGTRGVHCPRRSPDLLSPARDPSPCHAPQPQEEEETGHVSVGAARADRRIVRPAGALSV